MTARLDYKPARINQGDIIARQAVRSSTWQDVAQVVNYIRARGSMLVATMQLGHTVTAGNNATFRFRAAPGTLSKGACWLIGLRSGSATNARIAQVKVPSTASAVDQIADTLYGVSSVGVYFDTAIAGTSYAERELTFNVAAPAAGDVVVEWAACYETPRELLALDSTELGVDIQSLLVGQPIGEATGRSYSAIAAAATDAAKYNARRASLYHWYSPTGIATTSTSFTQLLRSIPVLNRKLRIGETRRAMRFRVYASATTNNGEVRLVSSKGGSTTVTVTAGAAAWYPSTAGNPAARTIDSEDIATADGLQSGVFDVVGVEGRIITSGTLTVHGVSCWEDPLDC